MNRSATGHATSGVNRSAGDWGQAGAGGLAVACGMAYLTTGVLFFADPTRVEEAGTTAYWEVLAEGRPGRLAFVAAFACTGLFALGVLGPVVGLLGRHGRGLIMAQRYVPEISAGDKRVLLVNGEPVPYALARIPAADDFRGNLASTKAAPTARRCSSV